MADITWDDVEAYRSALGDVPVAVQDDALLYVNTKIAAGRFDGETGIKTRLARIYLASHFGELYIARVNASTTGGAVSSETYGASSITLDYETSSNVSTLAETVGGAAYKSLVNRSANRVGFVV